MKINYRETQNGLAAVFLCPKCGTKLASLVKDAGKIRTCKCGQKIKAPGHRKIESKDLAENPYAAPTDDSSVQEAMKTRNSKRNSPIVYRVGFFISIAFGLGISFWVYPTYESAGLVLLWIAILLPWILGWHYWKMHKCPKCDGLMNRTTKGFDFFTESWTSKCPKCGFSERRTREHGRDFGRQVKSMQIKTDMSKLVIEDLEGCLRISVRWFRFSISRIGWTTLMILGCLLFGALAASSLGLLTSEEDDHSIANFLFSSAIVTACIYVMAAYWINRTTLDVTHDELSVFTKPFPLPWVRTVHALPVTDVNQLFVQEIQYGDLQGNHLASSYAVSALLECGDRVMLLNCSEITGMFFDTENLASIIEERIEAFLGIENVPVEKEIIIKTIRTQPRV